MDEQKHSVLIVDDSSFSMTILSQIMGSTCTLYTAATGREAIEATEKHLPDVILLDIVLPDMGGYDVIKVLKNSEKTKDIPIIFITGMNKPGDEERGLELGAADYITKPFSPVTVRLRVNNQLKMLDQFRTIERLLMTDHLTELPNSRSFDARFKAEWDRALREQAPISLLFIDIDHFKQYNDTYGHMQGDTVLKTIAKIFIQEAKHHGDLVTRWGGEEFIVLLPNTDAISAFPIAESMRKHVEDTKILRMDGTETKVTISIGINTEIPSTNSSLDSFVSGADMALYKAKREGRNKVCASE